MTALILMRVFFRVFPLIYFLAPVAAAASGLMGDTVSQTGPLKNRAHGDSVNFSDENGIDTGSRAPFTIESQAKTADAGKNAAESSVMKPQKNSDIARTLSNGTMLFSSDTILLRHDLANKEMFHRLGDYHRIMGIYGVIGGALTILAGAILLDKEDSTPFAMSFLVVGGISVGLGLWEIKLGAKLSEYKVGSK